MNADEPTLIEITSGLRFPEGPVAMADGSVVARRDLRPAHHAGGARRHEDDGRRGPRRPERRWPSVRTARSTCATTAAASRRSRSAACSCPARSTPTATSAAASSGSTSATGAVTDLYTECDGLPLRAPNDLVFDAARRLLVHRPRHPPRAHAATGRASTTPAPTARRSRRWCSRSTRPTASACRPTVAPCTGPRPTTAGCSGGPSPAPGELAPVAPFDPTRLPGRPARLPAARLAGRRRRRQRLRGHARATEGSRSIAPDGEVVEHVPTGDPLTTNICFGGPDLRTAYITLLGHRQAGVDALAAAGSRARSLAPERPAGGLQRPPVGWRAVPQRFYIETLGCPKNQVDSDKLVGHAPRRRAGGHRRSGRRRPRRRQHLRVHRGRPAGVDRHDPRPRRAAPRGRPPGRDRLHGRALRRRAGRRAARGRRGGRLRRPGRRSGAPGARRAAGPCPRSTC